MSDPTREDVIDVLVMSPMTDQMGTPMVPIRQTADAVLALFAPALRAARAEAWDESAAEACGGNWLPDTNGNPGRPNLSDMKRRNPYRQEGQ